MDTVVIRENAHDNGVTIYWHKDEMPAHYSESYFNADAARQTYREYDWREPDEDADRDVIAVANL